MKVTNDWRNEYPRYAEYKIEQFPARVFTEGVDYSKRYYIVIYKFWRNIGSFRAVGSGPSGNFNKLNDIKKFIEASTKKQAPNIWADFIEFAASEGFMIESFDPKKNERKVYIY